MTQSRSNATPDASPVSRSTAPAAITARNHGCRRRDDPARPAAGACRRPYSVARADTTMAAVCTWEEKEEEESEVQ